MEGVTIRAAILATVITLVPMQAGAIGFSGDDLLKGCDDDSPTGLTGRSLGYIAGTADDLRLLGGNGVHCITDDVSYRELYRVACAYVREHPKTRGFSATMLLREAFRLKYPCSK